MKQVHGRKVLIGAVFLLLIIIGVISFLDERHPDRYINDYSDADGMYSCSKPIKMHWSTVPVLTSDGAKGVKRYVPVSSSEAATFCRMTSAY